MVVGRSVGPADLNAAAPKFIHYVIKGASGLDACRTATVIYWKGIEATDAGLVPRFTQLPDVKGECETVGHFAESLRPMIRECREQVQSFQPVRNRASAVYVFDKLRSETLVNATDRVTAFLWGVMEALRMCGHLNDEDVEAYRERLRHCPGHTAMSFCAYCGDVCRVCGEADPCGQEDCAVIRFGDGPRDRGFPPAPAEPDVLGEIMDRP